MRRIIDSILLSVFVLFASSWACAQNGPTKPSAILSWTQSVTPNPTANCIYRGSVSGTYTMPALYCSPSPITTYVDNTVTRGATYYYAVTTKFGATESGYSNEVEAVFPTIAPPTGAGAQETKLTLPKLDKDAPTLVATVVWEK